MKSMKQFWNLFGPYTLTFLSSMAILFGFASCQTLAKDKYQLKRIGDDCIDEVFAKPPVTMKGKAYGKDHPCNKEIK